MIYGITRFRSLRSVALLEKLSHTNEKYYYYLLKQIKVNHRVPQTMDESKNPDSASLPRPSKPTFTKQKSSWPFAFLVTVLVPVVAATLLYQLDSFDPAPLPPDELTRHVITVPARNDHMLRVSEFVGVGNLIAPEDVAYDAKSGIIYTGCADGWISRVTVNDSAADSVVEKWINTGGRPLGITFGHNNELIVADPEKVSDHLFLD